MSEIVSLVEEASDQESLDDVSDLPSAEKLMSPRLSIGGPGGTVVVPGGGVLSQTLASLNAHDDGYDAGHEEETFVAAPRRRGSDSKRISEENQAVETRQARVAKYPVNGKVVSFRFVDFFFVLHRSFPHM
jgi:hypothetical protein